MANPCNEYKYQHKQLKTQQEKLKMKSYSNVKKTLLKSVVLPDQTPRFGKDTEAIRPFIYVPKLCSKTPKFYI